MARAPTEIRSLARLHTHKAIKTLVEIMSNEEVNANARVNAAEALISRGWGKPSQPVDGDGEGGPIKHEFGWKSDT